MPNPTTISMIAEKAGVSKSTATLALKNSPKVIEEKRLKIQKIARELGYKPNPFVSAQMAHIRQKKKQKMVTTIGFVSTWINNDEHKRLRWSIIGRYCAGAKMRAEELGFLFELFEFDQDETSDARIQQILESRNIDGIVLAPLRTSTARLNLNWSSHSLSAIGYYDAYDKIHRVFYDNYRCMQLVMTRLVDYGYQRIGFITNEETEIRAGHYWSGAYLDFQFRMIPEDQRVPLLGMAKLEAELNKRDFDQIHDWYLERKPDAIISFLDRTLHYFKSKGYKAPEDFGYVALTWTKEMGDCSGYNQCLEEVGAAAVDVVVDGLHRNERGIPRNHSTTLLDGQFIEGKTLRKRRPQ